MEQHRYGHTSPTHWSLSSLWMMGLIFSIVHNIWASHFKLWLNLTSKMYISSYCWGRHLYFLIIISLLNPLKTRIISMIMRLPTTWPKNGGFLWDLHSHPPLQSFSERRKHFIETEMFAFKKSRTLLAHTFSFLSRAPRRERLSSICGHEISMWSFCSGFASWLISPKPTLTDKSRVCVPVCVCVCVCVCVVMQLEWIPGREPTTLSADTAGVFGL